MKKSELKAIVTEVINEAEPGAQVFEQDENIIAIKILNYLKDKGVNSSIAKRISYTIIGLLRRFTYKGKAVSATDVNQMVLVLSKFSKTNLINKGKDSDKTETM